MASHDDDTAAPNPYVRVLPREPGGERIATHSQQPDVNPMSEEPPEPFSQLLPGVEVRPGDITKTLGANEDWRLADESQHGMTVPAAGNAFARLEMPEGYHAVAPREPMKERDLHWRTTCQSWEPILDAWVGQTASAIYREPNEAVYVCRPEFEPCNARELAMPPHHRELSPGEPIRRGDKIIHVGKDGWTIVSEAMRGSETPECDASNGWTRLCRPVHIQSSTWYVDPSGSADAMGGFEDPFPSVDAAVKVIEYAAEQCNRAPHGVIRAKNGQALLAYDLPEAPPARNKAAQNVFTNKLSTPDGFKKLKPTDIVRDTDNVEVSHVWEPATAIKGLPVEQMNVIRRKEKPRGAAVTRPKPAPVNEPEPEIKYDPVETRPMGCPVEKEKQSICWIADTLGEVPTELLTRMDALVPAGWTRLEAQETIHEDDGIVQLVKTTGDIGMHDVPDRLVGKEVNDFYIVRQQQTATTTDPAVNARLDRLEQGMAAILAELRAQRENNQ